MDAMNPAGTIENEGRHSLDDLLWEHNRHNEKLEKLFEKYHQLRLKNEADRFRNMSDLILRNCILNLHRNTKVLPRHIYLEEHDKSLKLLFIFRNEDLKAKSDEIFQTLPIVQNLAIEHVGRDFSWLIMSDEGFDITLPLMEEFERGYTLDPQWPKKA